MALTPGDAEFIKRINTPPTYAVNPDGSLDEAYKYNGYVVDRLVGLGAFTSWFLGGADGNQGMTPLLHQWKLHHNSARNVIETAGIGAGKTASLAITSSAHCITTPHFLYTNTAPTASQADLVFHWLCGYIDAFPALQRYVVDIVKKPYPTIKWLSKSVQEFRTVGNDGSALRGMERDMISVDEANYVKRLQEVHKALTGRLRGIRPDNRKRLGKLLMVTSPGDNEFLRELYEWGTDPNNPNYNPIRNLVLRATIYDNFYLDDEHIQAIVDSISPQEREVELMGYLPEGLGMVFNRKHVDAMESITLNHIAEGVRIINHPGGETEEIRENPPNGYDYREHDQYGVYFYLKPPRPGHQYVVAGDPGSGNLPKRNAAAVMVLDVTMYPYELVYFHWIDGNGKIMPFVQSYRYALDLYQPVIQGIDATGTQSYMNELLNEQYGLDIEGIKFNRDKNGMINALQLLIQRGLLRTPFIKGLNRQLKRYQLDDKELDQDLVCCLMMAAWLAYFTDSRAYEVLTPDMVRETTGRRDGIGYEREYASNRR